MGKNSHDISRFTPKNVVQRIAKFEILNFWQFLFGSFLGPFNMVVYGELIKCAISWKPLVVEQNGPKFGLQG